MTSQVEAYNLVSPEALAHPYPIYDALRRDSPVHWSEGLWAWILSCYEDVITALHDSRLSSDLIQQFATHQIWDVDVSIVADFLRIARRMMALQDVPQHTRLRKMASESFTRRALEAFRPAVHQVANVLLDRVQPCHRMDLVMDFAQPLPAMVIAEMFGIPPEDREPFQRCADDVIRFFGGAFGNVAEDARRANEGAVNLERYFLHLMAQRRREPGHDVMSLLLTQQEQGLWDEEDLSAQCVMILVGGYVTTIDQLCNGVHALLTHPDQLQKLRAQPQLLPSAVEEVLRYDTSVPFIHRIAREDMVIRGQRIAKGQFVFLGLASANHDPEQFADPQRFDITRVPNKPVVFGHGPHMCLGGELARRELEIGFGTLFQRLPRVQLAAQPAELRCEGLMFRGFKSMPLVF
jgi:cytochrome P450